MSERVVLAVVGSRGFPDMDEVDRWLGTHFKENWHVISGGAAGVDSRAHEWAAIHGDSPRKIAPDYDRFPPHKFGKDFAPKARNREIAQACDTMVAFWDGRSSGTANAIAWAAHFRRPLTIVLRERPR